MQVDGDCVGYDLSGLVPRDEMTNKGLGGIRVRDQPCGAGHRNDVGAIAQHT